MIINVVDIEATCWARDDPDRHVSDIIEIGLTQDAVDAGISFAEACELLCTEHKATDRPWASWGDYDRNQFQRQCAGTGVAYPFGEAHVNAKSVFSTAYQGRHGMKRALELAGLPLEGRHHDGADDSWNIAALVLHLQANGHWHPSAG